jgi:DNA-binding transcriptional regulator YdaS (Cro superfamily)
MQTTITPKEAVSRAGKAADLARLLGYSPARVGNWVARGSIPPESILKLMQLRPEWFKKGKT